MANMANPVLLNDYAGYDANSPNTVMYADAMQPGVYDPVMNSQPINSQPIYQSVTDQNMSIVQVQQSNNPTVTTALVEQPSVTSIQQPTVTKYNWSWLPWPMIIISILGIALLIYTAVAPDIDSSRRSFGVVLIILWTLLWALLLWVLWKENQRAAAWWLLLISSVSILLFFILIIVMNLGA